MPIVQYTSVPALALDVVNFEVHFSPDGAWPAGFRTCKTIVAKRLQSKVAQEAIDPSSDESKAPSSLCHANEPSARLDSAPMYIYTWFMYFYTNSVTR
jgi:hypothetical protein